MKTLIDLFCGMGKKTLVMLEYLDKNRKKGGITASVSCTDKYMEVTGKQRPFRLTVLSKVEPIAHKLNFSVRKLSKYMSFPCSPH
jgi:hypothetical protein